jgi:CRISPR/Cas system CMR-associated protein Cmr5 small subunit
MGEVEEVEEAVEAVEEEYSSFCNPSPPLTCPILKRTPS